MTNTRHGLLIVNTGDGKGKSTAAFGTLLRAWGRGFCICVVQFIKSETGRWGEIKAAEKLGIEWTPAATASPGAPKTCTRPSPTPITAGNWCRKKSPAADTT